MASRFIRPLYVPVSRETPESPNTEAYSLEMIAAEKVPEEDWIQNLIHQYPTLLSAEYFEPSFECLVSVCRELGTPAGKLDNFFVTPEGNLVFVECKLWKNPEARRKAIAQIIDYAAAISEWGYEELGAAINRANGTHAQNPLYDLVQNNDEALDEAVFVERVSKNLRMGRFLLLVVGDGIREEASRLQAFLQQKTGLQFTLGLLGLGIYQAPNREGYFIVPDVQLKTTIIERGIIRIENGHIKFTEQNSDFNSGKKSSARAKNLTETEFFEELSQHSPGSAIWLQDRLNNMAELGMTWDCKRGLMPRYSPDGETTYNFGIFTSAGEFQVRNTTWGITGEKLNVVKKYVDDIASLVDGAHVEKSTDSSWRICVDKRHVNIADFFGKEKELIAIFNLYIGNINKF